MIIESSPTLTCTSFEGDRRIASGELTHVIAETKRVVEQNGNLPILIFNNASSESIEVDFRGTLDDVLSRLITPAIAGEEMPRGRGRPKLGVVAREVTLLPRHWEWINVQPGGASVALRKLVEKARTANEDKDRIRKGQEVCYRFMSAMAGDKPGFEEASRALFAGNAERFNECIAPWPEGVREHVRMLAAGAF